MTERSRAIFNSNLLGDGLLGRIVLVLHHLEEVALVEGLDVGDLELSRLVDEVLLGYGDAGQVEARLAVRLVLEVGELVGDELLDDEHEQFVVVASVGQVLGEVLAHRLGHAVLLRVHERLDRHPDGHVHVVLVDVLAQVHARVRLRYADDGLDVAHGDRYAAGHHGLAAQIGVHARYLVLVHVVEARMHLLLGVHDVLLEQVLGYDLHAERVRYVHGLLQLVLHRIVRLVRRMVAHVRVGHEARQHLVLHAVDHVAHHAEYVETRQDRLAQVDVLRERERRVVAAAERIGGGQYGAARLQRGHNARLGDGDRLLLHGLVNARAILVVHLVELVDDAHALVGEHESARLQRPLARHRVLLHIGGQADRARALTGRVDGPVRRLLHILEELRLGRARVAAQQHVDVAAELVLAARVLGLTAEEEESDGALDALVAVDGRSDAGEDARGDALVLAQLDDGLDVLVAERLKAQLVLLLRDVVGLQHGGEDRKAVLGVERAVVVVVVDAGDVDLVARLARVAQVAHEDGVFGAWQAAGRYLESKLEVEDIKY